eukprot:CAMPEP_0203652470 /NCGR_PEP_ID=MMETSP0088-20131115/30137_1 /ASSEMBLY_ACC=CAM_ASM_001087 /TAXON_ID=426623 /ORGANISM="Chaetoceros affinis, Strain CCMP159" /LENGTH=298 /DNA_ID=CAMNT_0050512019 /DNA_START=98 /DNA_END=994 /DNA_ORIENTATION=-
MDYTLAAKSSSDSVSVASDSSSFLQERRAKQLQKERALRSRISRIASPDSVTQNTTTTASSLSTSNSKRGFSSSSSRYNDNSHHSRHSNRQLSSPDSFSAQSTMSPGSAGDDGSIESSLLSLSLSRSSGKTKDKENLRWEKMEVEFAFGLLTSIKDAPRKGSYGKKRSSSSRRILESTASNGKLSSSSRLLDRSPILRQIMQKTKELSKAAVKHRSGNILIKAKSPYIISVVRDSSYRPPKDRVGVVRSYVKAVIPIEISDVRVQELTRSSQIMSKILIRQALIEGVTRKIFEPLVES